MSLLYQTDNRLPEPFATQGCELLCTMGIACRSVAKYLSPARVATLTIDLQATGAVEEDISLPQETSPWAVLRDTFFALGYPYLRGAQVGSIFGGEVTFWKWYTDSQFDYVIERGRTRNGAPHSILLDHNFLELYNPHPDQTIATTETHMLYRVKRVEDWHYNHG